MRSWRMAQRWDVHLRSSSLGTVESLRMLRELEAARGQACLSEGESCASS